MPGSEDLRVVVQEPHLGAAKAPPTTPSRLPPWLQSRRNKALIATGLLCLLIPAVVVPAVVTSQKKSAQSLANSSSSHAVNQDGTTTLNATTFEDTAASNGSIKVPTRTLNKTEPVVRNLTIVPEVPKRFVAIKDGQFDQDCRPLYPTGFNAYELTTQATAGRKDDVDNTFSNAAAMGMTSARTWAHSIFPQYPFQTAPGQYDENGLKALDYVIDSARRHGIKLVLSFIDNWKYYNGVDQYVDWCGPARTQPLPKDSTGGDTDTHTLTVAEKEYETVRHAIFFREQACMKLYKDNVDFIVNRKNSYNGIVYKNDPTILAWNLINEPRCETWRPENSDCPSLVSSWFQVMADYVKSKDPNHLVTSGSEGFFGQGDPNQGKNPQAWAAQTGQNFVDDNRAMDFAVTHAWPDNWEIPDNQQGGFLREWLNSHLEAAETIGKPLLFEEFGKKLDNPDDAGAISQLRDPVFAATYDAVQSAVGDNRPLLGSMYWKWAAEGFPKGPYGVDLSDSTMRVIKNHANIMHRLVNAIPPRPGCVLPAGPDKELGAWFASARPRAPQRGCVNAPEVSLAYYNLYGPGGTANATAEELGLSVASVKYAQALYTGKVYVFATKADCCRPGGLGAYPDGCTV